MTQRVNIQYSIEVEQLPSEVSRLMKEVESQFKQMTFQPSTKKGDVEISLESISKINSLRQSLAAIDHGLMDVSNIMTGYINFVTTQEEESQRHQKIASPLFPGFFHTLEAIQFLKFELLSFLFCFLLCPHHNYHPQW